MAPRDKGLLGILGNKYLQTGLIIVMGMVSHRGANGVDVFSMKKLELSLW